MDTAGQLAVFFCCWVKFRPSIRMSTFRRHNLKLNLTAMKKFFVLLTTLFLFLALPQGLTAQCPTEGENDPCFSFPNGNCVCYPNGKLRPWISVPVLSEAQSNLPTGMSMRDCLEAYYRENTLQISYVGGDWEQGQSFRVEGGGSTIIVIFDGL